MASAAAATSSPPRQAFPYARYTSTVAVYCALLLSSALLLPRATFLLFNVEPEQISSRDKPQHPFLVPLTAKPLFTVAYAVSAALLLQIGWARRMAQWSTQAQLQSRTRWHRLSVRGMLFLYLARGRTAELACIPGCRDVCGIHVRRVSRRARLLWRSHHQVRSPPPRDRFEFYLIALNVVTASEPTRWPACSPSSHHSHRRTCLESRWMRRPGPPGFDSLHSARSSATFAFVSHRDF